MPPVGEARSFCAEIELAESRRHRLSIDGGMGCRFAGAISRFGPARSAHRYSKTALSLTGAIERDEALPAVRRPDTDPYVADLVIMHLRIVGGHLEAKHQRAEPADARQHGVGVHQTVTLRDHQ